MAGFAGQGKAALEAVGFFASDSPGDTLARLDGIIPSATGKRLARWGPAAAVRPVAQQVAPNEPVFREALMRFFGGQPNERTVELLKLDNAL